jgi:hypothetical protein
MRIFAAIVVIALVVAVVGWLRVRRRPWVQFGVQIGLALLAMYREVRKARKSGRWS